ncbi:MAG TPA: hypothetical protein VJI33_05320 [Candidatus Paceibacterota bacterium]
MTFFLATFIVSAILIIATAFLKVREVESGSRNKILSAIAIRLDPLVGRIIDQRSFISGEFFSDIFRFVAAKIGLFAARMLISLRNFSSKLAAHLYHTSRKAQSGDPIASHPSFFIKAILEFKEKMKEENKKNH